ncbi:MAG: sulfatase-like hydrolase/transferase [Armatimonadota bacterium]
MADDRPNVLIFMTDQQRADVIDPAHPCRTPNIQRIIDGGVHFRQHYTQTAHCCPSRASFMTGHYPSQHGVWNNILTNTRFSPGLNDGIRCFSEDLAENGYNLSFAGKWHVSGVENPADRGWKELEVTARATDRHESRLQSIVDAVAEEPQDRPRQDGELFRPGWMNRDIYGSIPDGGPKGYENLRDYEVVQSAIEELPGLTSQDEPWMLFCGTTGPHDPFIVPEKYATMYDPDEVELPESFWDTLEDKPRVYDRMRRQYWGQMSEREVRESIAHYWGYCTMLDAMFGELLQALEETGELDNTIVIYTSDHGDYCGDHGLYCKGVPAFEGAYHVPLAIRWPQGIKNTQRTCDEFTTHSDMAMTFWELAGNRPPDDNMPGRSIVPLLEDRVPDDWRDAMHLQFNGVEVYYTQRTVFTKDWKYVYNAFDYDELYDLNADPHEMHNLAAPCRNPRGMSNVPERRTGEQFQPYPELPEELDAVRRDLIGRMWRFAAERDDTTFNPYFTVALAPYGPAEGFPDE